MLRIQTDVHSEFDLLLAQRLAYALDHASPTRLAHDSRRLHQAADLLRDWNGDLTPNSAAAAIVSITHEQLWPMLLAPQIRAYDRAHTRGQHATSSPEALAALYTWSEKDSALEELLEHTPARWLPPGFANWDDLLATAVERGLQSSRAPANVATWRYGGIHPVEISHPLFGSYSVLSKLLGRATGTGLHPNGGDSTTIDATGLHFGPSERFTADLATPGAALASLPTGESGNPASPWYLDQFLPWLKGATFPLDRPTIAHTLVLIPQ
jgi:penicillin amidase